MPRERLGADAELAVRTADPTLPERQGDRLELRVHVELLEDVVNVIAHRRQADAQLMGDLLVLQPGRHPAEDLFLAVSQGWGLGQGHGTGSGNGLPAVVRGSGGSGPLGAEAFEGAGEAGVAVDRLQDVNQGEELGPGPGNLEDGHVDALFLFGRATEDDLEALYRLALAGHGDDRAVLVAETVSEDVLAPEHVVTAPAENLVGWAAQKTLSCTIPEDDMAANVSGEGRRVALGKDIQYFGALLVAPATAVQETSVHDFPRFPALN